MGKRKRRNIDVLTIALKHINYELNMLILVSSGLSSGVFGKSVLVNSLIESFAIHARNLIEFLWPAKPKNDHIIANDFFNDLDTWTSLKPAIPEILIQARLRAHKEIAHISYDRLKVKSKEKPWDYLSITKVISDNMSIFLEKKRNINSSHINDFNTNDHLIRLISFPFPFKIKNPSLELLSKSSCVKNNVNFSL